MQVAQVLLFSLIITLSVHSSDSYPLKTGEEAAARLDEQHLIFEKNSCEHVRLAGLKEGDTIIDMGCGSGAMTLFFAETVGEHGLVIAVDKSKEHLLITEKKISARGFKNVVYIQADILNPQIVSLISFRADMLYHRFVLMHLVDPVTAIKNIKKLLKNSGIVVGQESCLKEVYSDPPCKRVDESFQGLEQQFAEKLGVNNNIGRDLAKLYNKAGFSIDFYETNYSFLFPQLKEGIIRGFYEMHDKMLALNMFSSREEINQYTENLEQAYNDNPDSHLIFKQGHVIAKNQ